MTEKSNTWGFLKSLVVEDVPDHAQPVPPTPAAIPGQNTIAPATVAAVVVDPLVRGKIESSLIDEAPQGYKLLVSNLATLSDTLTSDDMLYKAVLKLLAKQGYPNDRLALDITKCLQILEGHKTEFSTELNRQVEVKVGSRKQDVSKFESGIQGRLEAIDKLKQEISDLEKQIQQENDTIAQETQKLEQVRANFEVAYGDVYQQVESQKKKIETYSKL